MNKHLTFILLCLCISSPVVIAEQAIVVVANTTDKSIQLTRQQVRNLFMGGAISYDLNAVSLPAENLTRVLFNTKVVGLTEARIQSYWAQMRFTGRKKAPKEINSEVLVLEYLRNHEDAVGYLPASTSIPAELTIIYSTL